MISSLCLLLLAAPQADEVTQAERLELAQLQPSINAAIDDGVSYLLNNQLADGSWDHLSELYPTGATALCVLALLKSGLSPEHPNVKAALTTMLALSPEETYSAGTQLMALEATRTEYYHNAMEPILEKLLKWRKKGGWSYPADHGGDALVPVKGTLDLSNIQYAALGLRAASFAEYAIKPRVWKDIVEETLTYQTPSGGFHYWAEKDSRFPVSGSMTSAGIATLSMCREALGKKSPPELDESITAGLSWLNDNFSLATNPTDRSESAGHLFYYLFGVERIGSFLDMKRFGGKNWYLEGAKRVVRFQKSDGRWNDPPTTLELRLLMRDEGSSAISDTCFALLFLRKASARSGEQSTKPNSYSSDDESDQVVLRATGRSGGITVWIAGFSNQVRKDFGSGTEVHGLRVATVTYLVDGEPVATVRANPKKPWKASDRYSQNIWLDEGEHQLSVIVSLVDPEAPAGSIDGTIPVHGEGFNAEVDHFSQRFDSRLTGLARRNLIGPGAEFKASSNQSTANFAADRIFATRWLSEASDAQPKLEVQLKQPKRATKLLICQAARHYDERREYDRISKLSVRINKQKEPLIIDCPGTILSPIEIAFEEELSVRTIELLVLEREQGPRAEGSLGISEISLE